ncbi:MAG: Tetraacyldisaccharide 4'-kinase [bacterium ADurb.Bin236]|nr:MAG: Tetraacyldisaccharide 4'-kinase [bacterium ADurb.Bin236]HOY62594.1 tetraacyldisaccharide 4'-kinase [bacterium]HPN95157.1 tetraacyldisaccharide 4'-kinase [bacterium]
MIIDSRSGSKLYPIMSGEKKGAAAAVCRAGMFAMSEFYRVAHAARMKKLSAAPALKLDVPVVSVGNITLGGTGKTPICRMLASGFAERGMNPGIATRGYGREGSGSIILSSRADALSWHSCGDEPILYLEDGRPVAVDIDRARGARSLIDRFSCGSIVLDDGFQFVTLARDADIAVIDACNPFGFGKLFPAGLLREPLTELKRATLFWMTRIDAAGAEKTAQTRDALSRMFPGTPIVESVYKISGAKRIGEGESPGIDSLRGTRALAVSGLGNPEQFERTVANVTGEAVIAYRFTDHHPYGDADLERVEDAAARAGADWIVTTEKDAVRLPGHFKPRRAWIKLLIDVDIASGSRHVEDILNLRRDTAGGAGAL